MTHPWQPRRLVSPPRLDPAATGPGPTTVHDDQLGRLGGGPLRTQRWYDVPLRTAKP